MDEEWRRVSVGNGCNCPRLPRTRWIILMVIGVILIIIGLWSQDWSMKKVYENEDVTLFDWTFSPSEWWNIAWVMMAIGLVMSIASGIKIGCLKCRGEI